MGGGHPHYEARCLAGCGADSPSTVAVGAQVAPHQEKRQSNYPSGGVSCPRTPRRPFWSAPHPPDPQDHLLGKTVMVKIYMRPPPKSWTVQGDTSRVEIRRNAPRGDVYVVMAVVM